ncbi:hypothetical protein [Methanolapillus millepedarum]|uniref:Uncharacterized protein n=1 Tax=Methanolapillus millepedarum TaxID=3028296 RepID=A0AA96V3B8_9EURY|nr:hypothetical protein MsAc7_13710 [Methanosarcinaceae archaeon Ac7]
MNRNQKITAAVIIIVLLILPVVFMGIYMKSQSADKTIFLGGMCICYAGMTMDEKIAQSDAIVIATLTDSSGVWNLKKWATSLDDMPYDMPINTEHTFETNTVLKGEMPDTFKKEMWGGTVDGFTYDNCSQDLEIGGQYILFIRNSEPDNFISGLYIEPAGENMTFGDGSGFISFEELTEKVGETNS